MLCRDGDTASKFMFGDIDDAVRIKYRSLRSKGIRRDLID